MKRLVRKLDNDGNSILHTIRRKIKDFVSDEKMKGPAFLSQEELLWFYMKPMTLTFLLCISITLILHASTIYFDCHVILEC